MASSRTLLVVVATLLPLCASARECQQVEGSGEGEELSTYERILSTGGRRTPLNATLRVQVLDVTSDVDRRQVTLTMWTHLQWHDPSLDFGDVKDDGRLVVRPSSSRCAACCSRTPWPKRTSSRPRR